MAANSYISILGNNYKHLKQFYKLIRTGFQENMLPIMETGNEVLIDAIMPSSNDF